MMTALQMATASFAVPKSVMKTMVGGVFGFLAVSRWVPKPRQPVNENANSTARKAIPSRLLRERMLLPQMSSANASRGDWTTAQYRFGASDVLDAGTIQRNRTRRKFARL